MAIFVVFMNKTQISLCSLGGHGGLPYFHGRPRGALDLAARSSERACRGWRPHARPELGALAVAPGGDSSGIERAAGRGFRRLW